MQPDEIVKKASEYLINQFQISPEKINPKAHLFIDLEMGSIDALDWFAANDRWAFFSNLLRKQ